MISLGEYIFVSCRRTEMPTAIKSSAKAMTTNSQAYTVRRACVAKAKDSEWSLNVVVKQAKNKVPEIDHSTVLRLLNFAPCDSSKPLTRVKTETATLSERDIYAARAVLNKV